MYSKAEATQLREAFWTTLGQYLAPIVGAEGEPVRWLNYKTGLKNVYFRLTADQRHARIGIELTQPDAGIRALFWEQFEELKALLHEALGEAWTWEPHAADDQGQPLSRISATLAPANVFDRADWPALISFFKPRLLALDAFWADAQWSFEALK